MRLLVKRDVGTKGGMFGSKQLFQMTLKLELSPEEQAAVDRFGLQELFNVEHPSDRKNSITYSELKAGKTFADTSVESLLVNYDLYRSALNAAHRHLHNHLLFPGETIVELTGDRN